MRLLCLLFTGTVLVGVGVADEWHSSVATGGGLKEDSMESSVPRFIFFGGRSKLSNTGFILRLITFLFDGYTCSLVGVGSFDEKDTSSKPKSFKYLFIGCDIGSSVFFVFSESNIIFD